MDTNKLGPQFHQLTMFHTARELRGGGVGKFLPADMEEVEDYDSDELDSDGTYKMRPETEDEAWERKGEEAEMSGLTEHIAEHGGVARPVDLSVGDRLVGHETGTIMNGHHRVAAQHDVNPDALVPVNWTNRAFPGSAGRKQYMGHEPEEKRDWTREDEARIGFDQDPWDRWG